MSSDYYALCPTCKVGAQVARFTAGGANHPDINRVTWFHIGHMKCVGYRPFMHEKEYYRLCDGLVGEDGDLDDAETYPSNQPEFDPNTFPWSPRR